MLVARWTKDLSNIDRVENRVKKGAGYAVHDVAIALREDIRSSWSSSSPSPGGSPPAVLSGNLDSAIVIDSTGRGRGGKFASDKDAVYQYVRVDVENGSAYHGRGDYGPFLEEGTSRMEARPFFGPAVERMEAMFPNFFGDIFRKGGGGEFGDGDE